MLREIERILEWPRIVKCTAISKGFSHEEKHKIELENKVTYFVKYVIQFILNVNKKNIRI